MFSLAELEVRLSDANDVYQDIARIPEFLRKGKQGLIKEGTLCKVTTGQRSAYLFVRGARDIGDPIIQLDDYTREKLKLKLGEVHAFQFEEVSNWGMLCWAWSATEPAYRISARLAVIGLVLGIAGLALGVLSLVT